MEEKEVLKTKICKACGREKELDSFYKHGKCKDGYNSRCKLCIIHRNFIRYKKETKKHTFRDNPLSGAGVTKHDYEGMWLLLKSFGYDLSRPIHEQFCEKYNLPLKKRKSQKTRDKYPPEYFDLT